MADDKQQTDADESMRNAIQSAEIPQSDPPDQAEAEGDPHAYKAKPSGFAAKLEAYHQFLKDNPDFDPAAEAERKEKAREEAVLRKRRGNEFYFFYGTLMDPQIAQQVLGLATPPVLKHAILHRRGHLRMWGPFPALRANLAPREDVAGMAFEVEGEEAKARLVAYEGVNYSEAPCLIRYVDEDPDEVPGEGDGIPGVWAKFIEWVGDEERQ